MVFSLLETLSISDRNGSSIERKLFSKVKVDIRAWDQEKGLKFRTGVSSTSTFQAPVNSTPLNNSFLLANSVGRRAQKVQNFRLYSCKNFAVECLSWGVQGCWGREELSPEGALNKTADMGHQHRGHLHPLLHKLCSWLSASFLSIAVLVPGREVGRQLSQETEHSALGLHAAGREVRRFG